MNKDSEVVANIHNYFQSIGSSDEIAMHASSSGFFLYSTLENQVKNRLVFNRELANYSKLIKNRYMVLEEMHSNDPGYLEKMLDKKKELYLALYNNIEKYLEIKYSGDMEELLWDDLYDNVKHLYYFFVLNYKENVVNLIIRYISENEVTIAKSLFSDGEVNRKDLTFVSNNGKLSKNMIAIINNLELVISYIAKQFDTGLDLINYIIEDDPDELNSIKIKSMFESGEEFFTDGNFQYLYFETLLIYTEIESVLAEIIGNLKES